MIFMSGFRGDTKEKVQEEISVGVGTLVGSTIMLITIPYAVAIFLNRRKLGGVDGRALSREKKVVREIYNKVTKETTTKEITVKAPVLPKQFSLTKVGATSLSTTPKGAIVMMLTAAIYFIVQLPAFVFGSEDDQGAAKENNYAAIGFFIALASFLIYLYWIYTDEDAVELIIEKQRRLAQEWAIIDGYHNMRTLINGADPFIDSEAIFELFDKNKDGAIDFDEMCNGWNSIGYSFDNAQAKTSFNMLDTDRDGHISKREFINWIEDYLLPQFIVSQPSSAKPENPTVDNIQNQLQTLPVFISDFVKTQIGQFLRDPNVKELPLQLTKDERYSLHIWASDTSFDDFYLQTHSENIETTYSNEEQHHDRMLFITKIKGKRPSFLLRPVPRALIPGCPAWSCASDLLLEYFKLNQSQYSGDDKVRSSLVFDALFHEIDTKNTGTLSLQQIYQFSKDYKLNLSPSQIKFLFYSRDSDFDHYITQNEFQGFLESLVEHSDTPLNLLDTPAASPSLIPFKVETPNLSSSQETKLTNVIVDADAQPLTLSQKNNYESLGSSAIASINNTSIQSEEEEEEDEGENEEHANLSPKQKFRLALIYIVCATLFILLFADPMCDTINVLGNKMGISPFYISFIVTPLASNASEVIAALKFSQKKTDVTMGLTLSSLYGAATMNNTFCLSVLLALVWLRELPWTYTAETIGVIFTMCVVGVIGLNQTLKLWHAIVIALLFPLSIFLIWILNKYPIDIHF